MSLTLDEALKIAEEQSHDPMLEAIEEYPDRYVLWYGDGSDEECIGADVTSIMKDTGKVCGFFPPDFDEDYLESGKRLPIPEKYRA